MARNRIAKPHRYPETIARLDQAAFATGCQFTPEQLQVLDEIAAGRPPRNALAILRAMETKAAYAYSKPKQEVGVSGNLTINVQSGIDDPPGGVGGTD